MICDNCGTSLSQTAKFCSRCGTSSATGSSLSIPTATTDWAVRISPVSTLFVEPASQKSNPSLICVIHPAANAAGACVACGKFHCRDCLIVHAGSYYCRNCAASFTGPPGQSVQIYQPSVTSVPALALGPQSYDYFHAAPVHRFAGLPLYYQQEFSQIAASGETYKGKWNWAAFFFGPLWALIKGAWLTFLAHFVIALMVLTVSCGFGFPLLLVFPIIYGLRGNYIYYSVVEKQKQLVF